MFNRRRPLLRAAAVGGGAYLAGKKAGQRQSGQEGQAGQANQAGQQAPAPAAQASQGTAPAGAASIPDQLNRLSALHEQGALTDAEFSSAKAKLLGT
jgi:hypothetical protein